MLKQEGREDRKMNEEKKNSCENFSTERKNVSFREEQR